MLCCFVLPIRDLSLSCIFGFSRANSHPITPDSSRATTPVEDIETFDPARPSLSPGDSILLPIGKIPSYLDAALKALALHTEARTSFITYVSSFLLPSPINLMSEIHFFNTSRVYFGTDGAHADIGCRVYSNTNTSPCDSSRSHHTKRQLRCTSRPRLTSSPVSSCYSAESARMMRHFGPRRPLGRLRRMARRSGRMSSASMRCARPIARCSECWSGAAWKSNEYGYESRQESGGSLKFFFYFSFGGFLLLYWFTCSQA